MIRYIWPVHSSHIVYRTCFKLPHLMDKSLVGGQTQNEWYPKTVSSHTSFMSVVLLAAARQQVGGYGACGR